jgi:hypothetical protein
MKKKMNEQLKSSKQIRPLNGGTTPHGAESMMKDQGFWTNTLSSEKQKSRF